MISKHLQDYFLNDRISIVKPADEVAFIHSWHKLDHAMLILTSDMYNVVPVLDRDSKLVGLISMSHIIKQVMAIEGMSFDNLDDITVEKVMERDVTKVREDFEFEEVLKLLVNTSFICVVDQNNNFKGIITRSDILKGANSLVHNLENDYELTPKEADH